MADRRTRIQSQTAARWTSTNPILLVGEMGHESDAGRIKVGDGITPWNSLFYTSASFAANAPTNFTDTLTVSDSEVLVDADIGVSVQAYSANLKGFADAFNLPTSDGTANQVLKTDGTGTLSFVAQSGGSLPGLGVTASAAELNTLDGITATTEELNTLDGITATTEELNHMDGVTSNVQTQLDAKAGSADIPADISDLTDTTNLLDHFSGDYNDLINTPTIPADVSDLTDTSGALSTSLSDFGITASAEELNKLDGLTTSAAELNTLGGITATTEELNKLDGLTATTAELNYIDGVTSNIQTQLDAKADSADIPADISDLTDTTNLLSAGGVSSYNDLTDKPTIPADISDLTDTTSIIPTDISDLTDTGGALSGGGGASSLSDLGLTASAAELNKLDGLTTSTTELNKLDGLTASTTDLNKLDGLTATTAELNYIDGVTSNVQTQLDAKQALDANLTAFIAAVDFPTTDGNDEQILFTNGLGQLYWGSVSGGGGATLSSLGITATAAELNYMDGVTSNVQTQLDDIVSTSGTFSLNLNQQGELAVVTGTARWYAPFDLSVSSIVAYLAVAADADVSSNILKNNSTVKTVTITSGQLSTTVPSASFSMLEGDYITVDTTAVGSSAKGEDLVIQLKYSQD